MDAVTLVNLDRRFKVEAARDDAPFEAETYERERKVWDWSAVIDRPRVVILAEAGAGKSTEFKAQTVRLVADGRFAFCATVQDVGKLGLRASLSPSVARSYDAWRTANTTKAWFFIDSVDEARLDNVQLQTALRNLATAIDGAERRAHIVLSGRYTDWDVAVDGAIFDEWLPVQSSDLPSAPTSEELLGHILRSQKLPAPPAKVLADVFYMAPLDEARVRSFAAARGANDIDGFVTAIEAANVWRFAGRPLDLGWMVDFWKPNKRLGSLCEMVDASLTRRSAEWNRRRGDATLDPERCRAALERVGAALVFGHVPTVRMPSIDGSLTAETEALDLTQILPDWSEADVQRLIGRPVFDPSSSGRSRLHSDNEGDVRAFLAARWLKRLRDANCPLQEILALLFAEVYEHRLIRPAAEATAAWLSLWDPDIAREVVSRNPLLLMNAGDPASLHAAVRADVLVSTVDWLAANPLAHPIFDHDKLRRFTTTQLDGVIRRLWSSHGGVPAVRQLLLMMIWLGRLSSCADLALAAAMDVTGENVAPVFAGRAVVAHAAATDVQRYADHIRANDTALGAFIVWDAAENLFPDYFSVTDLMRLIDIFPDDAGNGFRHRGVDFAKKLRDIGQMTAFLEGLMGHAAQYDEPPGAFEHESVRGKFGHAMTTASIALMERLPDDELPHCVIDPYLWLNSDRFTRPSERAGETALRTELCRTSSRRRVLYWRAAERLNGPSLYDRQPLQNQYQLQFFGWPGGLERNDIAWLLEDVGTRSLPDQRRLALSSLHGLWQQTDDDPLILSQIKTAISNDEGLVALHDGWLTPQAEDPEIVRLHAEGARYKAQYEAEQQERDASWEAFIAAMQADVPTIRDLQPRTDQRADTRLFQLWKLARSVCAKDNEHAFWGLAPIEPVFGADLTEAFQRALMRFWRQWTPTLVTDRPANQRNLGSEIDSMGIAAISVEAASRVAWAQDLSDDEARLATYFATLELNRFPGWLVGLTEAKPEAVALALTGEVEKELDQDGNDLRFGVLEHLTRAEPVILRAIGTNLLPLLQGRPGLQARSLETLLDVLVVGLSGDQCVSLKTMALERAMTSPDLPTAGNYLATAFAIDSHEALEFLQLRLDGLAPDGQTELCEGLLPRLFGDQMFRGIQRDYLLPFDVLKRLVNIAFNTIRIEDDLNRPSLETYSPILRDHAEHARSAIFGRLLETPGRATYNFLLDLSKTDDFPIPSAHLIGQAERRALLDAEAEPWEAGAAFAFEKAHEHAPATGGELQDLVARRLTELNHELSHGDFNQGRTLKLLPDETAVQNWVAHELRRVERSSFGVDREAHRVSEKKPDIVARAKASDANVAIEIKVVDDMSVAQLDAALTTQLCQQYLRSSTGRHGILLLVYKDRRALGWEMDGKMVGFESVVDSLVAKARQISAESNHAPQPIIAVLNVSDVVTRDLAITHVFP